MKFSFRKAKVVDLPILYEFEQGIVAAERPFDSTLKEAPINYYDIKAMIESDDTEVIVAVDNDIIVGSGYVKILTAKSYQKFDKYAYVGFMFVRPEYRGMRVSHMILEELKGWAKTRNLNELRLEVYDDNVIAVSAYKKYGFSKNLIEMRMYI